MRNFSVPPCDFYGHQSKQPSKGYSKQRDTVSGHHAPHLPMRITTLIVNKHGYRIVLLGEKLKTWTKTPPYYAGVAFCCRVFHCIRALIGQATGDWPKSWRADGAVCGKQSRNPHRAMFAFQHPANPFTNRESSRGRRAAHHQGDERHRAPVFLLRGHGTSFLDTAQAGVARHCPPEGQQQRTGPLPKPRSPGVTTRLKLGYKKLHELVSRPE